MNFKGRMDSNDVDVKVSYQVEEMLNVNEVIEVEKFFGLQDLQVNLEELGIVNVSLFQGHMEEEKNEWDEDREERK